VDDDGHTKVDGVWAGGDVTQLALVTDAIGHGRHAAESIHRSFGGAVAETNGRQIIGTDKMHLDHYEAKDRLEPGVLELEKRMDLDTEVNLGFTEDEAFAEADRCMSCGYCFDCEKCWLYCQDPAIDKPMEPGELYTFKLGNCTGCAKCAEICPCGFIEMA
ncbi:MAG: glutamate synthase, partial [Gemmatimonadetes bacterium]|nr:glutamate synthase [Gemmatimonadota bacterium]NIQ59616.1 glutamate synthase [Gemmatimonadota bacterium]NIU79822.1 glutamate synthase [Gammaproteobacteria bacterium]NIX25302.1 glutamate synthase [Actinomycetota bacterium]NIX48324.1 glutamate synthase [Gemmatimonadota bacterium]